MSDGMYPYSLYRLKKGRPSCIPFAGGVETSSDFKAEYRSFFSIVKLLLLSERQFFRSASARTKQHMNRRGSYQGRIQTVPQGGNPGACID